MLNTGTQRTMKNKITVINAEIELGILILFSHLCMGCSTTAKQAPKMSTIQKGRKMKKVKINVINKRLNKKYLSNVFVCILT